MTDRDGILLAVCENPEDDLPRLAYADLCEENGDEARARYIRACLKMARAGQEPVVLTQAMGPGWDEELTTAWQEAAWAFVKVTSKPVIEVDGDFPTWYYAPLAAGDWSRGFPWVLRLNNLYEFDEYAAKVFRKIPITAVQLGIGGIRYPLQGPDMADQMWKISWEYNKMPEDLASWLWDGKSEPPRYRSEAEAAEALNRACVKVGRTRAGLKRIDGVDR
jgi:uncharacterized protein (TIGR02996 family)